MPSPYHERPGLAAGGRAAAVGEDAERERRTLPPDIGRRSDLVALQLGALYLARKDAAEAQKWLVTVRHEPDSVGKARLMLAKLAFERGDAKGAQEIITRGGFLEQIPRGPVLSDLYLERRPLGHAGRAPLLHRARSAVPGGLLPLQRLARR